MAKRPRDSYPLLPACINPAFFWSELHGRRPNKNRTPQQLRESLRGYLAKSQERRNQYVLGLFWMGREVQLAMRDVEERRRVNVYTVSTFAEDDYLSKNKLRLHTDYLDLEECQVIWLKLSDIRTALTLHLRALQTTMLSSYAGTLLASARGSASREQSRDTD